MISEKVGQNVSLQGIVGFIDGTFHECAHPMHNQQVDYNRWKHSHGTKYQGVMAPDGMFVHLGGPCRQLGTTAKFSTSRASRRCWISLWDNIMASIAMVMLLTEVVFLGWWRH